MLDKDALDNHIIGDLDIPAPLIQDAYSHLTDRELLEHVAAQLDSFAVSFAAIQMQVGPLLDKVGKNPMLRGLFG